MTLGGNSNSELLPFIACFFAIFGLTFVDLLRWFALPPWAAYVSLGSIALYSIGRFWDGAQQGSSGTDDAQMAVVAELLVLVQAVLMLQQKNRRIYEQLAIFCLLELIVAAIFNNALSYGLLLVPLGVVGAAALALLQTYHTTEEAFASAGSAQVKGQPAAALITVAAPRSADSFHRAGLALPWIALTVLAPAVLIITLLFFYGLPRTSMAASRGGGNVQVGFSESVRLGQIGRMLQSDALAVRVDLLDRRSGKPYFVAGSLYLRGAVLERYLTTPAEEGTWSEGSVASRASWGPLPLGAGMPERDAAADDVRARITLESSSNKALFALAPYHRLATDPGVLHQNDRWLLSRPRRSLGFSRGVTYQFATTALRSGELTRLIPRFPAASQPATASDESVLDVYQKQQLDSGLEQSRMESDRYVQDCLEYDEYRVPSAWGLSDNVLAADDFDRENPLEVASALERYLIFRGGYRYTLDLGGEPIPGLDPIEQFLSVERQGNCQHFASALTLMLRSQGIPARLVVGYNTDEFNALGGYYVARQLHAHAWVEALIDARWIPSEELAHPARRGEQYWVRLDPTPGGGGVDRAVGGRVSEVFELAQNMWTDYVVQRSAPVARRGRSARDADSYRYQSVFLAIERGLSEIRAGQIGGGALRIGRQFSWTAALLSVAVALVVLPFYQFGWPKGRRWRRPSAAGKASLQVPRVAFYAETLELLGRVGFRRSAGQTPLELTTAAAAALQQPGVPSLDGPLRLLTDAFYDTRFGGAADLHALALESTSAEVIAALQSVRARVEMIEARAQPQPF